MSTVEASAGPYPVGDQLEFSENPDDAPDTWDVLADAGASESVDTTGTAWEDVDLTDRSEAVNLPGGVSEARLVHGAIQWQIEMGGLNGDEPAVSETQKLALDTMNARMVGGWATSAHVAIENPAAAVWRVEDGKDVFDMHDFEPRTTELNDAEEDEAVPMSAEDLFGDDDDDVEEVKIDLATELSAGKREIISEALERDPVEAAKDMGRTYREMLVQEQADARAPEPYLGKEHIDVAVEALMLQRDTLAEDDLAGRAEIEATLQAFDQLLTRHI